MLLTIDKHGSKITRNSVFDSHCPQCGYNSISSDFYVRSSIVLTFQLLSIWCEKRGSNKNAHVLLNLINKLRISDKM